MSGASSAFLDGYLSERERSKLRRQDLELSELLEICAKPTSQEERVSTLQKYGQAYPELKYFLIVAYFCKETFSELRTLGKIEYIPSTVQKGASIENIKSLWSQVMRLYNEFPTSPKAKLAIARQLLMNVHKDDAEMLNSLIEGTFYRKELNEQVVRLAFPKEVPADPKA